MFQIYFSDIAARLNHHCKRFLVVIMKLCIIMVSPPEQRELLFAVSEFSILLSSAPDVSLGTWPLLQVFSEVRVARLRLLFWLFNALCCVCLFSLSSRHPWIMIFLITVRILMPLVSLFNLTEYAIMKNSHLNFFM